MAEQSYKQLHDAVINAFLPLGILLDAHPEASQACLELHISVD